MNVNGTQVDLDLVHQLPVRVFVDVTRLWVGHLHRIQRKKLGFRV